MSFSGPVGRLLVWLALLAVATPVTAAIQATPVASDAPVPIVFPRDDGPHDSTIEWWYFTGHLFTDDGERYGFEYVTFRAREGSLEGYVSHFAVTDNPNGKFNFDQRIQGAAGVSGDAAPLDIDLNGWTMQGGDGRFDLAADMPAYAVRLEVATTKPAALHDGDGYIDYGNGTASYYYSWTRMDVSGTLDLGQGPLPVSGEAWMDHQWGDFETFEDGGWDWFAVQLEDGTDVMLYLIRDADGGTLRVDGSIVSPRGELTVLGPGDFTVRAEAEWTSPETETTYPSRWTLEVPSHQLVMRVTPSLPDQELDTRPTTGVIYWEGEAIVDATRDGQSLHGFGYVELTGYAPYEPLDLNSPAAGATPAP
ncbi:MAG TPA: lipocalin-like domain-containing protein [Thermomicrobiales bacterium]|nr:lipocalin-like domain-containing protein [Thermomicrobiales bacterium]